MSVREAELDVIQAVMIRADARVGAMYQKFLTQRIRPLLLRQRAAIQKGDDNLALRITDDLEREYLSFRDQIAPKEGV